MRTEELDCPSCSVDVQVEDPWRKFNRPVGKFSCPCCDVALILLYDEEYDPGSGDEYGWFWLEEVET